VHLVDSWPSLLPDDFTAASQIPFSFRSRSTARTALTPASALASFPAAPAAGLTELLLHHFFEPSASDIAIGEPHLIAADRQSNVADL
jgi:hypothetical protein